MTITSNPLNDDLTILRSDISSLIQKLRDKYKLDNNDLFIIGSRDREFGFAINYDKIQENIKVEVIV